MDPREQAPVVVVEYDGDDPESWAQFRAKYETKIGYKTGDGFVLGVAFITILLALVASCVLPVPVHADDKPTQDISRAVTLAGYDGLARGCPISPLLILTARHVARSSKDDNGNIENSYMRMEYMGRVGQARYLSHALTSDIAYMVPSFPLEQHYTLSSQPARMGDIVLFLDFNRDVGKAMEDILIKVKVQRVVAGHLYFSGIGDPGASGSCVWNQAGDVVGIMSAISPLVTYKATRDGNPKVNTLLGRAVSVWQGAEDTWVMPAAQE